MLDNRQPPRVVFLLGSGASQGHSRRLPLFATLLDELRSSARRATAGEIPAAYRRRILSVFPALPPRLRGCASAETVLIELDREVHRGKVQPEVLDDLRMGIWWLFARRTAAVLAGATKGPYDRLARVLEERGASWNPLIVNLSWDEVFERRLADAGLIAWESFDPPRVETAAVLKPSGSVGLIASPREGDPIASWSDRLEVELPASGEDPGYGWEASSTCRRPLMVFPGVGKISSHWYLWSVRRRLALALESCRVVIAIGVGLARSDGDIVRLVEHAMWHRLECADGQLPAALLVDLNPGRDRKGSLQRLQEVLRPRRSLESTAGFEAWVGNPEWIAAVDRVLG